MFAAQMPELLLTERVDTEPKRKWISRIGWALFDLSAFAIVILLFA